MCLSPRVVALLHSLIYVSCHFYFHTVPHHLVVVDADPLNHRHPPRLRARLLRGGRVCLSPRVVANVPLRWVRYVHECHGAQCVLESSIRHYGMHKEMK